MKSTGTVYLVGAGPGDAGLLTLRGAELLGRADVVVYDALVNAELTRLAPATAEIIYAGKRAKDHALSQDETNALLVAKARAGKTVVRLKGGDPFVFGRGGEEAEALAAAGVRFEVVPGVTSIVAGPAYAGIPLTHRDHCSSFTVMTGHENPAKEESSLDFAALAQMPGTKVVLMGVERIRHIADALLQQGMKPSTPVALVRWGTTERQETLAGTLATIAGLVEERGFKAPAVTVIGDVVTLRSKLGWFETRPLFGKRVVVTRTRRQASALTRGLRDLGADVLEIPTIKIAPPDEKRPLVEALASLGEYDWIVFTSPNGVETFFDYFFRSFPDVRDLGAMRLAAVGPATAALLQAMHLHVDVMPKRYVANEIAEAMSTFQSVENLRILLARAQAANRELLAQLETLGAIVDDVACYKTVAETEDPSGASARLLDEGADWITFTSSSTVEHFHARFDLPKLLKRFPNTRLASIGPETSKALQALGLAPHVEAADHTLEGLIASLDSPSIKQPPM